MRGVLLVIAVFLLTMFGTLFYLNWVQVTTVQADDRAALRISVDRAKIKEDFDAANLKARAAEAQVKEKAQEIKEAIQTRSAEVRELAREKIAAADDRAVNTAENGTISGLDPAKREFTLSRTGEGERVIKVAPDATFKVAGRDATWEDVKVGQDVTCVLRKQGDRLICVALSARHEK